jgi:hypothetical protein
MPDTPIAIMSAHLWDLRAQCEQQVRALTDAQQQLDALRDGQDPAASQVALDALQADLARVVKVNLAVRETGCLAECSIMPHDGHAPDFTARTTADVEKVRRAGGDVRVAVGTCHARWNLEARLAPSVHER